MKTGPMYRSSARFTVDISLALALSAAAPRLADAAILSGRVIGPGGAPVAAVDIDVDDAFTGERIPTTTDTTDADGTFDIVVPNGVFNVIFNAPKPRRLVSRTVTSVSVSTSDENMGDVALAPGALVSGRVVRLSNGSAVANADTDIDLSFSGERLPTPEDDTDGAGQFSVVAPFGTIDLTVEPDKADRLVAWRAIGLVVTGDVNLGNIPLGAGFLVSGTTSGPSGPLSGVDVDAYDAATGRLIPTPDSSSGAGGAYSFVVLAGTFDLKAGAPLASETGRSVLAGVAVSGDLSLPISLFAQPLSADFENAGRLVLAGGTFRARLRVRNGSGAPLPVRAIVRVVDPRSGVGRDVIPPFDTTLGAGSAIRSGRVSLRIPPNVKTALRGVPFHLIATFVDPSSMATFDSDFLSFEVR